MAPRQRSKSPPRDDADQSLTDDPLADHEGLQDFFLVLCDMIRCAHPRAARIPQIGLSEWFRWRQALADLVRIDDYAPAEVEAVFTWLFQSDNQQAVFWRAQVHSIPPLRLHKNGKPAKFAVIYEHWQRATRGRPNATAPPPDADTIWRRRPW